MLGEAGDDFAADRPPFSADSGIIASLWHVDVPSRHLPPELQARALRCLLTLSSLGVPGDARSSSFSVLHAVCHGQLLQSS